MSMTQASSAGGDLFTGVFDKEKYAYYYNNQNPATRQDIIAAEDEYESTLVDASKKMRDKIDDLFSAFEELD